MAAIYLSYKLEDRQLAQDLAGELESLGHRAIYDAVALSPGTDWRLVLMNELSNCDVVVILLTKRALTSPFVLGELGAARALGHAFGATLILPVLLDDDPVPPVVSDLFVIRMRDDRHGVVEAAKQIVQAWDDHTARARGSYPRLFISHRHSDVGVAQALVKVIETAFEVRPADLRCTSVHPYKLRVGDRTTDRLKAEIRRAEAVLGILTPDTKASSYVLFELGASWGRGGVTFPLLARGATVADVPAPIGDLHTLSLGDASECHQLIDDLADVVTLRRTAQPMSVIGQCISELTAAAV
jgi:TIR domain